VFSVNEVINKVTLKLEGKISDQDLRLVRDTLQMVLTGYTVEPVSTEVIPYEYQLPDCYKYFLASKTMDGRMSPKTREQYRLCLEPMLRRMQLPVEQITANHLRGYLLEISTKPDGKQLSPATLNQRKSIIRSFFSWLAEEEYIQKDPSLKLHQEKVSRKPEPVFTDLQMEQIRAACKNIRDEAIMCFLVSSGVRITECVELKKEDVDLDQREAVVLGKGNKYRTVYFDARTEFALRKYLNSRKDDSPYMFVSLRAPYDQIKPGAIRSRMMKISKETGIVKIHPHRFRHTMATGLVEKGCDITDVQQMLGHTKLDTTMRYTHTSKKKVKAAHEKYAG
jgi:site-specific recombinase XerD